MKIFGKMSIFYTLSVSIFLNSRRVASSESYEREWLTEYSSASGTLLQRRPYMNSSLASLHVEEVYPRRHLPTISKLFYLLLHLSFLPLSVFPSYLLSSHHILTSCIFTYERRCRRWDFICFFDFVGP